MFVHCGRKILSCHVYWVFLFIESTVFYSQKVYSMMTMSFIYHSSIISYEARSLFHATLIEQDRQFDRR